MEEIERIAEVFLAQVPIYVWDGRTLPVPIEDIADTHVGLLVRNVENLAIAPGAPKLGAGQSLSGLLFPALGEIWVDAGEARDWPARRRFTIAHELGHWALHRDDGKPLYCRSDVIASDDPERTTGILTHEEQANLFAAAALMPARLITDQYARAGRDFDRLCRLFGASGAAMGRRLHAVIPPRKDDYAPPSVEHSSLVAGLGGSVSTREPAREPVDRDRHRGVRTAPDLVSRLVPASQAVRIYRTAACPERGRAARRRREVR